MHPNGLCMISSMELKKTLATLIKIDAFLDVIGYNNDEIRENIKLSKKEIEAINYTRCCTTFYCNNEHNFIERCSEMCNACKDLQD